MIAAVDRRALPLLLLTLLFGCFPAPNEVRVFAAASLTDALTEIAASYKRATTDRVAFNFAASSVLARQIESGAPADLFLSADEAKMDALAKRGLIVPTSRARMLSNELVIVVPPDSKLTSPQQLAEVDSLALAEPSSVPAGIYARTYLQHAGLWDRVAANVIPTENVRGALAAVAAGNADAAIVYRTDARIEKRVRVAYAIHDGPPISYPFALLRNAPEPQAAMKFLNYLQSADARAIFARHGFVVR